MRQLMLYVFGMVWMDFVFVCVCACVRLCLSVCYIFSEHMW